MLHGLCLRSTTVPHAKLAFPYTSPNWGQAKVNAVVKIWSNPKLRRSNQSNSHQRAESSANSSIVKPARPWQGRCLAKENNRSTTASFSSDYLAQWAEPVLLFLVSARLLQAQCSGAAQRLPRLVRGRPKPQISPHQPRWKVHQSGAKEGLGSRDASRNSQTCGTFTRAIGPNVGLCL